jgi:hypothetical protein
MEALDQMHSINGYVMVIAGSLHLLLQDYQMKLNKFRNRKESLEGKLIDDGGLSAR